MSKAYKLINVGSHANPPADMWAKYFPKELQHKAPIREMRNFPGEGTFEVVVLEGEALRQVGTQVGLKPPQNHEGLAVNGVPFAQTFSDGDPGQRDPIARIDAQNRDGVDADVIIPPGWPVMLPKDRATKWGLMHAYNTWIAEFCAHNPSRLIGIAEIPVWDIPLAVQECKRVAKLGLKGVLMPMAPGYEGAWSCPADAPYYDPRYTELWKTLNDLNLPIVLHADAAAATKGLQDYERSDVNLILNKTIPIEMIATMICHNIFYEFPNLKVVCIETGVGWMAHTVSWMEVVVQQQPRIYQRLKGSTTELFRKHVSGSFLWDTIGVKMRNEIGIDCIMWCNDYPHEYGPWPNSAAQIDKDLAGISAADRQKILADNAVRVFSL